MTKPAVCIVSLYAWPLFDPECTSAFGGSEVRIATIARGLARRGALSIRLVVWDHGQGARTQREGIEFFAWPDPAPPPISTEAAAPSRKRFKLSRWAREADARGGLSRLAAFLPLSTVQAYGAVVRGWHRFRRRLRAATMIGDHPVDRSRFELLDSVDADVMVVHGATTISSEIVAWCRARRRPCVFLAGSDHDFQAGFKERPDEATIYGDVGAVISFGIENATEHVVQTPNQAALLRSIFGRDSTVVPNPIDLTPAFPRQEDGSVLWIGKSDSIKRPEIAMEVARRLPSTEFLLVMSASDAELHRRIVSEARTLPNVRIEPFIPFERVESLFARASVFLSTSAFEGFPNTFLQAAKYGVPIASLAVDPAGMLRVHGAGFVSDGDVEGLVRDLGALLADPLCRATTGARALAYVREHHDPARVLERYESVILGTVSACAAVRAESG